jgi:hypothetical protein
VALSGHNVSLDQQENTMRSIISIVLPAIAAISISGLMFTATLA